MKLTDQIAGHENAGHENALDRCPPFSNSFRRHWKCLPL